MNTKARAAVFNVPPGVPFADALAKGVLDEAPDALALADVLILLPNRRACRALADAFLRQGGGRAMLLPALRPIGDIDADEVEFLAGDDAAAWEPGEGAAVPPAIAPARRIALLARLILKRADTPAEPHQAVRLAEALAQFLDHAQTERLSFEALGGVVDAGFATHWQKTLDFLKIVTAHWPDVLAAEDAIDPARRRDLILGRLEASWRARPPPQRVIAAGSTGSVPASADLMDAVARLPRGAVVLPGLDRAAFYNHGEEIAEDPAHPQHGLARLLQRLGVEATDVKDWPGASPALRAGRAALLSEAMRPAKATDSWKEQPPLPSDAMDGAARVEFADQREEALAIALMMRETLEAAGRTAALVTPDRGLAGRVAAELMGRWNIQVDDSAGRPLAEVPPAVFMRLVARMIAARAEPVPLLACLKHPLARLGEAPARFRGLARRLEMAVLRGPRPAPGFEGLLAAVAATDKVDGPGRAELSAWVRRIAGEAASFAKLVVDGAQAGALLEAHARFAERLATTEDGDCLLWRGEAGEMLAAAIAELQPALEEFPPVAGTHYPALFEALLRGRAVRPPGRGHPRLFVWGLLEARLQRADRVILGGLNEGVWPAEAAADPWMSRPMRRKFGLPPPERRIGLAAHDFAQAFLADEVILTRATRVEGTPTVASRWWLRLEAVLRAARGRAERDDRPADDGEAQRAEQWRRWVMEIDRPRALRPAEPPAPRPPLAARPRTLSVTQIETWMRDPYAIYARHVLRLPKLDALDAEPGPAARGVLVHHVLDRFVKEHPGRLPSDVAFRLQRIAEEELQKLAAWPEVWAFWRPRLARAVAWLAEHERAREAAVAERHSEIAGTLAFQAPGGAFTLTARADRIDRLTDGRLTIIDYKTGAPPRPYEVETGLSPQLPLEAAIAEAGGFARVGKGAVESVRFWRLSGGSEPGSERIVAGEARNLAAEALKGLQLLVAEFDDPSTPYHAEPRPHAAPRYSDYVHLARIAEWSAQGGEE